MKLRPRPPLSWGVAALTLALAAPGAHAQRENLADLSLEQLADIEVTSVGKRVQRLADVAGSVFVIQQEDIRRSGATTLPEVLRLAPNLQVARADANQYAITARGFNSTLANKILVLVDGRTVYSPLFSGVFWEAQDLLLQDIERIEVLSGAGGTLYGSNAVNGVINIITRNAAETTGVLLKGAAGNQERSAAGRYGAEAGAGTPWRVYGKHYETEATRLEGGGSTHDASQRDQAGFRADHSSGRDQFTFKGDLFQSRLDQLPSPRRVAGGNLLARWSRDDADGSRTQLQAYVDRAQRNQPGAVDDTLDTWDLDLQRGSRPAPGHELLWGAGYRLQHDHLTNLAPAVLQLLPTTRQLHLWNLYGQDDFALRPGLRATLGLKAEHNGYTGLEWLPTARLAWNPMPAQLLWASASRTVRTPSRIDTDAAVPALGLLQSPGFESEVAKVFELGWRAQPRSEVSYSLTLFHHAFERLRSLDMVPGGLVFGNHERGHLTGIEAWGSWRLTPQWRLQAGYTYQRLRFGPEAGSAVLPASGSQLGNDPRNRAQLGLAWDLPRNMELDLMARYVGHLPDPNVPAYTAVDLRWGWRLRPDLELSVSVRNLNDSGHVEWGTAGNRAEIPRSFLFKAVWRL